MEECIEAILMQDYNNNKLLLIDNGSSDNSGIICDRYALNHLNIIAIHQKNKGVSSARNNGLKHAIGVYITFVDSDDFILSNVLSRLISK